MLRNHSIKCHSVTITHANNLLLKRSHEISWWYVIIHKIIIHEILWIIVGSYTLAWKLPTHHTLCVFTASYNTSHASPFLKSSYGIRQESRHECQVNKCRSHLLIEILSSLILILSWHVTLPFRFMKREVAIIVQPAWNWNFLVLCAVP